LSQIGLTFVFDTRNCSTPIDKRESHVTLSLKLRPDEKGSETEVKGGDNDG
jgi:hypothetical protein